MGLSPEDAEQPALRLCVRARLPGVIFRAAMAGDGVPGADVLQVWLDVDSHLSCSEARDEEIRHRVSTGISEERR
jgi:hypothetical protein